MNVEELMTAPAWSCHPEDSLHHVADLLWRHDCGALPVVDAVGHLVGMVTDRDVCMGAYIAGAPLAEIPVRTCMAKQLFTCRPSDPVELAVERMCAARVRRLPVVDSQGRLQGLVALNDLARGAKPVRSKTNPLAAQALDVLRTAGEPRRLDPRQQVLVPAPRKRPKAARTAEAAKPVAKEGAARKRAPKAGGGKRTRAAAKAKGRADA